MNLADQISVGEPSLVQMFRSVDEAMKPFREMAFRANQMMEPYRKLTEHIEEQLRPMRLLAEQVEQALAPIRATMSALEGALAPHALYIDKFARSLDVQFSNSANIRAFTEAQQAASGRFDVFPEQLNAIHRFIASSVDLNQTGAAAATLSGQPVSEDACFGDLALFDEAKEVAEAIGHAQSLDDLLTRIGKLVSRLNERVRGIVVMVVVSYLVTVLGNLHTPYYQRMLHKTTESFIPANHKPGEDSESRKQLVAAQIRFVTSQSLRVKSAPEKSADIVDMLSRGREVRALRKHEYWTFIEYDDPNTGSQRQGWVSTGHLAESMK